MADGVVHLAGDAGALGEDGLPGQQLPLGLGALGPLAQRVEQLGAGAHPGADAPGSTTAKRDRASAAERVLERVDVPRPGDGQRSPRPAATMRTGQRPRTGPRRRR